MVPIGETSPASAPATRVTRFGLGLMAAWIATLAPAAATPALEIHDLAPRSGPRGPTMFAELPPERTGIVTENRYADPRMWGDRFREFEIGAIGTGVAIGDYDGDGRPDIFVVSKTESCRLFRNLGDWKFEDVTDQAGVGDAGEAAGIWKQGVTFADVNNDGRPDIYVCRFNAPNLLYINQGDGTFKDEARAYGLDVNDASVMAAFCDYDRDGRLDLFLQTNVRDAASEPAGRRNYLFHNNGNGTFTDVTVRAGISGEAQGHSAIWWDYDGDGWPDLYVANDFAKPDRLYHNNGDGTFADVIDRVVPHMPYSAMGSDLGDVNNDGFIDLFVAEMAASTHAKDQRTMAVSRSTLAEDPVEGSRTAPQDFRNALYLNTGTGRCLEGAYLAGLAATDWTWSVRLEDLDNDGRLDLFVTNGMVRESHNADLMNRQALAANPADQARIAFASPPLSERHLAYRNDGGLTFTEVGAAWGLNQRGVSFGAAFGDLDGDGDLDLVYANYQKGVTVLRNDSDRGHRVMVALHGGRSNRFGIGSVVRIRTKSGEQVRPLVLARGYLSSSEPVVHFGLGEDEMIDELSVEWPSGAVQPFENLAADRRYEITEPADAPSMPPAKSARAQTLFHETGALAALASHEAPLDESGANALLPMRLNRRGPPLAVGGADGAGREIVVVGGTAGDGLRILRTNGRGGFDSLLHVGTNAVVDDGPILMFDSGDGSTALLVTEGGVGAPAGTPDYQPWFFLSDGDGNLTDARERLPTILTSVGAAAAADFQHSGKLGLFLGGRVIPGQYPHAPRSALLANRGGHYEDVTDELAPGLREVGMVSGALWSDVDGDGWPDLLLALEWGQVKCFRNHEGRGFTDDTERLGFAAAGTGWWTSIAAADFNGDGRMDYVVGNVGLNTPYHADAAHPALLYAGDFKSDGTEQLIEAYDEGGKLYPWRTRRDLGAVIPAILRKFPRNDNYAHSTLEEILGKDKLAAAQCFTATELQSGVFLSQPDGTHRFRPLPRLAQIAPIEGMVTGDFDGDGKTDLYAVQNSYAPIPQVGRFDGGLSQLLKGDGRGNFSAVPARESGLIVPGDAKAVVTLDLNGDGSPGFVVSRNDSTPLVFAARTEAGRHFLRVILRGPAGNRDAIGAQVTLEMSDGNRQTMEIAAGSGYYSQSAPAALFGWSDTNAPRQLRVRWPDGRSTVHPVSDQAGNLVLREE
ncbi:MAG TPA: FG-GAP-like repeat-containing protein [Candidatus Didemnitutus sp.]|jgi:hypothetical protein